MPDPSPANHPSSTIVRRKPSLDFSVTGLVYCSMMMFMGLAAINSQANLLFGVFGLMIGILFITMAINRVIQRKLIIRRSLPENGTVGEPIAVTYSVSNQKKFWPALSVTIAELDGVEAFAKQPHAYLLHAAAGTTAVVPAELIPKRRGLHHLNHFQISTSFPFGFIKRAMDQASSDNLLVFPAMGTVDQKLLALFRSAESSGSSMRPRRGGMDEFYGVKEFRSGENPRYIYWRRSARTGTLVSKEMTHVSPPKLLLLVDTCVGPGREPARHADVERVIAMAATLIDRGLGMGLAVGLFTWSEGWTHLHANRGKRHRRDMLTALARLPLNVAYNHTALMDASYSEQTSGTTAVLLTPDDVQLGLGESARGSTVVISTSSLPIVNMFQFNPRVDFNHCMPPDHDPVSKK